MRISDWSSDVCSSDLRDRHARRIIDEGKEQILPDIGHGRLAQLARADDPDEITLEQGHARAFHGDVGAMPHRNADIGCRQRRRVIDRSEEHTSELQSLMRISYAVFCLQKKKKKQTTQI